MKQRLLFLLLSAAVLTGCFFTAPPPQAPSPVYTDWSRLTPYVPEDIAYETFQPYSGDHLTARDDYGLLLPYVGAEASPGDYIVDAMPLYGLMTADGRVVTDPVYASVYQAQRGRSAAPFLLLCAGHRYIDPATGQEYPSDYHGAKITLAAPDGSWVLEGNYCRAELLDETRMALTDRDGSVRIADSAGNIVMAFPRTLLASYLGQEFYWGDFDGDAPILSWYNGYGLVYSRAAWEADPESEGYVLCLDPNDGTVSRDLPEGLFAVSGDDSRQSEPPAFPGYGYANPLTDPVTGQTFYYARRTDADTYDVLSGGGTVLVADCGDPYFLYPFVWNGWIGFVRDGVFCYYTPDGDCVFRYPIRTNSD